MKVIKAPTPFYFDVDITVFLAGSIEMGKAEDWQSRVSNLFKEYDNVTFLNPRRNEWDAKWVQRPDNLKFKEQVDWELDGLDYCKHVFFYFDPNTISPITLLELGMCIGLGKEIFVCCPDEYFRKGNVEITCARYGIPVYNDFDHAINALGNCLKSYTKKT